MFFAALRLLREFSKPQRTPRSAEKSEAITTKHTKDTKKKTRKKRPSHRSTRMHTDHRRRRNHCGCCARHLLPVIFLPHFSSVRFRVFCLFRGYGKTNKSDRKITTV